ncbi:MAG: acyltransferase family protein [Beutenbergiaceae bacterium]
MAVACLGGYVGVDVFFVISGFLITSHLYREVERTGTVHLLDFWARRIRRLLPASLLVLAVSLVLVLAWVPTTQWLTNARELIASALYVENWALAADAVDYLAEGNQPSVAQHFWSLSVEEQFYLIWPLLMLAALALAMRTGWNRRYAMVAALSLVGGASFVW